MTCTNPLRKLSISFRNIFDEISKLRAEKLWTQFFYMAKPADITRRCCHRMRIFSWNESEIRTKIHFIFLTRKKPYGTLRIA